MLNNAHIHPKCFTSYIIKKKIKQIKSGLVGSYVLSDQYSLTKNKVTLSLKSTTVAEVHSFRWIIHS